MSAVTHDTSLLRMALEGVESARADRDPEGVIGHLLELAAVVAEILNRPPPFDVAPAEGETPGDGRERGRRRIEALMGLERLGEVGARLAGVLHLPSPAWLSRPSRLAERIESLDHLSRVAVGVIGTLARQVAHARAATQPAAQPGHARRAEARGATLDAATRAKLLKLAGPPSWRVICDEIAPLFGESAEELAGNVGDQPVTADLLAAIRQLLAPPVDVREGDLWRIGEALWRVAGPQRVEGCAAGTWPLSGPLPARSVASMTTAEIRAAGVLVSRRCGCAEEPKR